MIQIGRMRLMAGERGRIHLVFFPNTYTDWDDGSFGACDAIARLQNVAEAG